ncbi:MAG: hypothetical protein HOD03_06835 [Planctomycetes bacterium]|nr:hypothetical protein [Planctomycetota bacterium]
MQLQKLLLLALLPTLLPACGPAVEDSLNNQPSGHSDGADGGTDQPDVGSDVGSGDADQPAYEPEPPSGAAVFYVNHNSGANDVPPGDIAKGFFAGADTTEGIMGELNNAGTSGGLLRQNLRVNLSRENLPTSLLEGERMGFKTWITAMGTPLDQSPSTEGEEYPYGLEPYARWNPMSADIWADTVVTRLENYELLNGFVPSFVEIWNEPDRREFYNGDIADYLEIYTATSQKIKFRWPQIQVGGMGLAGHRSEMGGTQSAVLSLIDHAASNNLPLDFVSWHHYTIANELQYSGFLEDVRQRLDSYNMPDVKLIVSEWNLRSEPSAAFDHAHNAANYAGFQTTARELGLDGNIMFMAQDSARGNVSMGDFAGNGMGAITEHGIKKPAFHVIETIQAMSSEPMLTTIRPEDELSVNVYATKMGNRVRYVVSNDSIPAEWVWSNRLRDAGLAPGYLWPLYSSASKNNGPAHKPNHAELLVEGMTEFEIATVRELEDELNMSWSFSENDRPVKIVFGGGQVPNISNVRRFDNAHNNFADRVDEIMPYLVQAEDNAKWHALNETANYFGSYGIDVSAEDIALCDDMRQWAIENNVPRDIASKSAAVHRKALAEGRLLDVDLLNSLPQMSVNSMTAEEAQLTTTTGSVSFNMEPDSVVIFDIYL